MALKPISDRLELSWPAQFRKLKADEILWGYCLMAIPSAGGAQESVCLPLRMLPTWLFSISPSRVAEGCREALILYRRECADVLWKHWSGQHRRELAQLKQQNQRLQAFCLAFNPLWAKVSALQRAGVQAGMVRFRVNRTAIDATDLISTMEDVGVLAAHDWVGGPLQRVHPPIQTGVEALSTGQGELPLQDGVA